MNILFLGGSRYFGKTVLDEILKEKKNFVFLVNRNSQKINYKKKNLVHISCDRKDLHLYKKEMQKKIFDVVFDNIAYKVKDVKKLHQLLKGRIKHYIFTSSIMTYLNLSYNFDVKEKDWNRHKTTKGMLKNWRSSEINNYAKNKIKIEKYLLSKNDVNSTILRIHNVVGKNDFSNRTKKLLSFPLSDVKKNNISNNDFIQFCLKNDLVKVILKIFQKKIKKTNVYNVANRKMKTNDFFKNLKENSKNNKKNIFPYQINILMDCSKIEKDLKFKFSLINKIFN